MDTPHRTTTRTPRHSRASDPPRRPGGLRGLYARLAAPLGNGDDLVDDYRGWREARRAARRDRS